MNEKQAKAEGLHIIDGPKIDNRIRRDNVIYLAYRRHITISNISRVFNLSRKTVYRIIRRIAKN